MECSLVHTTEQQNFDGLDGNVFVFCDSVRGISNVQKTATRLEGLIAEVR
jgi:hypothetical protein